MPQENDPSKSSKAEKILIIEDHPEMVEILTTELARHHYDVRAALSGEAGLMEATRHLPDLIILDLMLPGIDGWEVCRALRKDRRTEATALLILTALGEESSRIKGLESGADDYLGKPFSLRELVARIRALLRRKRMDTFPRQEPIGPYWVGPLMIDTRRYEIRMAARLLRLTRTEFSILKHLARHPGNVFTRNELINALWGEDRFVEEHNLDVHIHSIRRQLEPDPTRPKFLMTVRGYGYKFTPPQEVE